MASFADYLIDMCATSESKLYNRKQFRKHICIMHLNCAELSILRDHPKYPLKVASMTELQAGFLETLTSTGFDGYLKHAEHILDALKDMPEGTRVLVDSRTGKDGVTHLVQHTFISPFPVSSTDNSSVALFSTSSSV